MKTSLKTLSTVLVLAASLGGCAVYGPPPAYTYYDTAPGPVYSQPGPVYVQPAPVYVEPAPVYVGPPLWFGLNFGYSSGRHGWGGHGRRFRR
jgi:hypothetical protein